MAVSKRISWNFEEQETELDDKSSKHLSEPHELIDQPVPSKAITASTVTLKQIPEIVHDYENASYDIYCPEYNGTPGDFKPTKYSR